MVCGVRCLRRTQNTLKETFQLVSEASIDTKLLQLPAPSLKKREQIIEDPIRILGLVSELESAAHAVSEVE